jgi:hypothetical protein
MVKFNVITLNGAKSMAQYGTIPVEDHGYFELINFLAAGQGDAEALEILLAKRRSFCRAVTNAFDERIRPILPALIKQFGGKYEDGRQLVLISGGKSRTFHIRPSVKLKKAA